MAEQEVEFEKNPVCTIKGEPVAVFGGFVDVVEACGEHFPCPECGSVELRLIRNTSYHPMGFRLACDKCGFEIPESLEDEAYKTEEGVELAAKTWDRYVANMQGQEIFNGEGNGPIELDSDDAVKKDENDNLYVNIDGEKIGLDTMEALDKIKLGEDK